MTALTLIDAAGALRAAPLAEAPAFAEAAASARQPRRLRRRARRAASRSPTTRPAQPAEIDWDATLAFRHHVWSWGLGVADAMDTAQRNMGLDAAATRELITPQCRRGGIRGRRRSSSA